MKTKTPCEGKIEIKIRPNPFSETLIIQAESKEPYSFFLTILDSNNKIVKSGYWGLAQGKNVVNLGKWSAGENDTYTLKLIDTNNFEIIERIELKRELAKKAA